MYELLFYLTIFFFMGAYLWSRLVNISWKLEICKYLNTTQLFIFQYQTLSSFIVFLLPLMNSLIGIVTSRWWRSEIPTCAVQVFLKNTFLLVRIISMQNGFLLLKHANVFIKFCKLKYS